MNATREDQLVKEILRLDHLRIKGLGPAVASILYFLHPTLMPPFNTGIVNGYNALYGEKRKLGSWRDVVPEKREREVVLQLTRPSFKRHAQAIRYILFSDLRANCEAPCRCGGNPDFLEKLAKQPVADKHSGNPV